MTTSPAASPALDLAVGVEALRQLAVLRRVQLERAQARIARQAGFADRARSAAVEINEVRSSAGVLARAAEVVGRHLGVERVVVSAVADGRVTPRGSWRRDAGDAGAQPELAFDLRYPQVEAEVGRLGAVTEVVDVVGAGRRAATPLTAAYGWVTYVVTALITEGRTVGLLHVEPRGTMIADELVDPVGLAATAIVEAFAVATLREAVARHREHLRDAMRSLGHQLDAGDGAGDVGRRSCEALRDPLTSRELEVMALLARGLTNREIAIRLVLSEGTVKFHVRNVLRKFGAVSRADAVARYHGAGAA